MMKNEMDSEINAANCCRACLGTGGPFTPISSEDNDSVKFCYKVAACVAEVSWAEDDSTSLICEQCIQRLRISYDFRNTCLTSDKTWQTLSNLKNTNIQNPLSNSSNFEFSEPSTSHVAILQDEQESSEYLHLKHFLDSEEDLNKEESILPDDGNSRSSTPNSSDYINDHFKSQTIEIQVHDIQEIIIEAKPNDTENKVILNNNGSFIKEISSEQQINDAEFCHEEEEQNYDKEANKSRVDMRDESVEMEEHEVVPIQLISAVKTRTVIKKNTGIQVRPPSPLSKGEGISNDKSNTCTECGKSYRKRANLKIHMRTHTGEKPFECKYCESRFYHSSHLREHIRRHTGEKPFQCALCVKRFTIKGELTMHMKSHTGEKPYPCSACDRRCLTASDLKIHMRTHTGEKPFTCDTCGKKFGSAYVLNSHIKTHTGERPYKCDLCKKNFTQSSHLTVHMRKHTGEKVNCKLCKAEFTHSSQLTVHMRGHTGKQPYQCGVCDKACNYASELQTHMMKHTGEKFSCVTCQKQFTSATYLAEHRRIHTGENLSTCSICQRQFTRQQYLEKHLRIHTGEKPYGCFICGRNFSQSSSLKVHTRIHTGERPYACTLCDKRFITSSDLSSHAKKHKKYIDL